MTAQPARKRPFGVKVIIVLQFISIFGWLLWPGVILSSSEVQADLQVRYGAESHLVVIAFVLAMAALQLVILIGFIRLRRWAWYMVILLAGASLAANLWRYFLGVPDYLVMVTNVLTVLYLNQREVQQAFRQLPGQEAQR